MINQILNLFFVFYFIISPTIINKNVKLTNKDVIETSKNINFDKYSSNLYDSIANSNLDYELFNKALKGYHKLLNNKEVIKEDLLSIIDFRKSANKKRLFIIDLKNKKTIFEEFVAHGTNTGVVFATKFSNKRYSNQSSLGFYITGKTYKGRNGFSLKLHGKEQKFNSNAFQRGVVMHGAKYVSENFIKKNGRLGRSFGCPAVDANINVKIINCIKDGSCLFIYYPDKEYISKSEFINLNLDLLKI